MQIGLSGVWMTMVRGRGFLITPVVVWAGADVSLTANADEVAAIHRIPLTELLRDDAPMLEKIPESEHPVLFMPIGNDVVAAPTAAMIYQFREVALCGNDNPRRSLRTAPLCLEMIGGCGYRKKTAFKGARDDPQTERGFTIPAQHISFAAIFIFHLLSPRISSGRLPSICGKFQYLTEINE